VAQVTARRELDTAPRALVVAVAIALLTGVVGAVLLGLMLRERGALSTAASAGGLTLKVESAQWAELEHDHQQGFQMPAQMTPGAPAPGQQRLAVEVAILNRSDQTKLFSADELGLQGPDGKVSPLAADNLGGQRLGPGLGINASLTFDLPEAVAAQAAPELFLVWSHAGKVARLPLTVGAAHAHQ
jgi:hypothetical protein